MTFRLTSSLNKFPSPLWGGIKGGGRSEICDQHSLVMPPLNPHPGPPHKGEGDQ